MTRTKVQSELIATNAISGTIIADGAITSTHLAANCVDSSELVTGSIDTIHIAANQVTATKIVTNGVLTRHISDDQVTADKIANATITTTQIASNTIATGNVADNAIDGTKIASNSILTRHIDDNQINIDQLNVSDGSNGQVLTTNGSGTLSFSTVSGTTINNNADNRIITGSGTANTLEGESAFLFDGDNAVIGHSSAFGTTSNRRVLSVNGTSSATLNIGTGGSQRGYIFTDGSFTQIASVGSIPLRFGTNDTERMRITSTGSVGINETSPDFTGFGSNGGGIELDDVGANFTAVKVSHGATGEVYLAANTGAAYLWGKANSPTVFGTNNAEKMRLDETGRLIVGGTSTSGSTGGVTVSGAGYRHMYMWNSGMYFWNGSNEASLTSGGAFSNASDERLKENITDIPYGLAEIKQLKPKKYNMIDGGEQQVGLIAQEVETIIPEVVTTSGEANMKSLSYGNLNAVLIKAIQELEARVKILEG